MSVSAVETHLGEEGGLKFLLRRRALQGVTVVLCGDAFAVVEARALMCYWEAALLPEPSMDAALRDRDAPQSFAVRAEPSSTQAIGRTRVMAMIDMGPQGGKSSWRDRRCQAFCSNRLMGVSLAAGIPVAAMVQAGVP